MIIADSMVVAYLRVSTGKQNLANQQDEIRRFAAAGGIVVDRWVTEVVSGRKNETERKLGPLLGKMRSGDTLIVTELSRLSRTLTDIMAIMGRCLEHRIVLYSIKEGYAFDDSINSKVLCFAFGLAACGDLPGLLRRTVFAKRPSASAPAAGCLAGLFGGLALFPEGCLADLDALSGCPLEQLAEEAAAR